MEDPAHSQRYSRQVRCPRVGEEGQRRLLAARAVLVGCGALGASLAEMLVRSGVGHLRLVDRDIVDATNLGRQATYTESDAAQGLPKAAALAAHLRSFNPTVTVEPLVADCNPATIAALLDGAQLVLDGTDNLETRYLINDVCVRDRRPWIYGGCVGVTGITATIIPGVTQCLRCLFPEPPPAGTLETCESAGILAPAAAMVAAHQASEALKILSGHADSVRRTLLRFELWPWRSVELGGSSPAPRSDCPACALGRFDFLNAAKSVRRESLCGRNAVQLHPARPVAGAVDLEALAARLQKHYAVTHNGWVLRVQCDALTITLFDDGRALVTGTGDPVAARSAFDRVIGG